MDSLDVIVDSQVHGGIDMYEFVFVRCFRLSFLDHLSRQQLLFVVPLFSNSSSCRRGQSSPSFFIHLLILTKFIAYHLSIYLSYRPWINFMWEYLHGACMFPRIGCLLQFQTVDGFPESSSKKSTAPHFPPHPPTFLSLTSNSQTPTEPCVPCRAIPRRICLVLRRYYYCPANSNPRTSVCVLNNLEILIEPGT